MRTCSYALVLAGFALTGCGNEAPPVDWGGKYATSVQTRLDGLIAKKDCASLKSEWHTAHAINDAKKRSSGSGSADLVAYVEWGMDKADCEEPK